MRPLAVSRGFKACSLALVTWVRRATERQVSPDRVVYWRARWTGVDCGAEFGDGRIRRWSTGCSR